MSLKLCIRPISLSWFAERLGWKKTCTFCNLEDLRSLFKSIIFLSAPSLKISTQNLQVSLFFFIFFFNPLSQEDLKLSYNMKTKVEQ